MTDFVQDEEYMLRDVSVVVLCWMGCDVNDMIEWGKAEALWRQSKANNNTGLRPRSTCNALHGDTSDSLAFCNYHIRLGG